MSWLLIFALAFVIIDIYKQRNYRGTHTMAFANVDYAIKTRLVYNLDADQVQAYERYVKANKIKALYEKLAILNIMSFGGYPQECMCTRTRRALANLLSRGLVYVDDDICHLSVNP